MHSQTPKPRSILILSLVVMAAASLTGSRTVHSTNKNFAAKQQEEKHVTNKLPLIISKVKKLEVLSATIEGQDGSDPVAALLIKNNSNKAVISVTVECGDDIDSAGVNVHGFIGDNPPLVVIKPHGTLTVRINLSNLFPGLPLRVAGVIYADETEDGDKATLERMHGERDHERAKGPVKEGAPIQ